MEGSLDRVLFAAELDFPKVLSPRLPQNISNVNNECVGKSKQQCSLYYQPLGALIYLYFILLILMFLIVPGGIRAIYGCSSSKTTSGVSWRNNIVAVITCVLYGNIKRKIKNRTLPTCRLFLQHLPSVRFSSIYIE